MKTLLAGFVFILYIASVLLVWLIVTIITEVARPIWQVFQWTKDLRQCL